MASRTSSCAAWSPSSRRRTRRAQLDLADLRALPPQQLQGHALEACRALASLVDRKASKEAEGVKRWLVAIAQRTAEAAKEGGFLGSAGRA